MGVVRVGVMVVRVIFGVKKSDWDKSGTDVFP